MQIIIFENNGEQVGIAESGRSIILPIFLTPLTCGGFAAKDKKGILVFDRERKLIKEVEFTQLDNTFGLAEDDKGYFVTINQVFEVQGCLVLPEKTDLVYIDPNTGEIVKWVNMVDVIEDPRRSNCRYLAIKDCIVYVVDIGLGRVYRLQGDQADVFGDERGFKGPMSLTVDSVGNLLIADTVNKRLSVIKKRHLGINWKR